MWDFYVAAERYEQNRRAIEEFYNSIEYQVGGERIGKANEGDLRQQDKINLHFCNKSFLDMEVEVPEGILYRKEFFVDSDGNRELRIRFYLDDTKSSYVEIFSDQSGFFREYFVTDYHYWLDFKNCQERVAYAEYQENNMDHCLYLFWDHKAGAGIYAEEGEEERYQLAKEIIQSVRFE